MTLAPSFRQHHRNIFRVQIHMQAPIRVMQMTHLAIPTHIHGVPRKQRKAVLFNRARRSAEPCGIARCKTGERVLERCSGARGAVLIELALGCEAGDCWAWAGAIRQVLMGEDSGGWTSYGGLAGPWWREGIAEDEEAEPG